MRWADQVAGRGRHCECFSFKFHHHLLWFDDWCGILAPCVCVCVRIFAAIGGAGVSRPVLPVVDDRFVGCWFDRNRRWNLKCSASRRRNQKDRTTRVPSIFHSSRRETLVAPSCVDAPHLLYYYIRYPWQLMGFQFNRLENFLSSLLSGLNSSLLEIFPVKSIFDYWKRN